MEIFEQFLERRYNLIQKISYRAEKMVPPSLHEDFVELRRLNKNVQIKIEIRKKNRFEKKLSERVKDLFELERKYPDLSNDKEYMNLKYEIIDIENILKKSNTYYNQVTSKFNKKRDKFPYQIIAEICRLNRENYFFLNKYLT